MIRRLLVIAIVLFMCCCAVRADSVTVTTAAELAAAVDSANHGGPNTILVADGVYTLSNMLWVSADHVTVRSLSGNRTSVILQGTGMTGGVSHIFNVPGSWFTAVDMTLRRVANHAVQIHGNAGASYPLLQNLVFQDTFEQMVKISYESGNPNRSVGGIVANCLFEYTAGVGPQYYIGGVDGHQCLNWIVRDSTFRNIRSPDDSLAEHAVHFWSGSENTLVERNLIINCDRGIGFGLGDRTHLGGIIRNNMIYQDAGGINADVGIGLESCQNTHVYNNTIFLDSAYPNAIEYRFAATTGVVIENNLGNRAISLRDGASGTVRSNITTAQPTWFVNTVAGDLHLASAVSTVVDSGLNIAGLIDDFDRDIRPFGPAMDIGADEWGAGPAETAVIALSLNDDTYVSDDRFLLEWTGSIASGSLPGDVYIMLDTAGGYWFWPSWSQTLDASLITLVHSSPIHLVILDFTWPDTAFMNMTIRFWSIMTHPDTFDLASNIDWLEAYI